jgi:DNA-directed RNA polymerase
MSALTKNADVGEAVGLTQTNGMRRDIYADVAAATQALLEQSSDERATSILKSLSIDRKLAKGPTMTLAYGIEKYGVRKKMKAHIEELKKTASERGESNNSVFDLKNKHADYLGNVIWEAVERAVPSAQELLTWLKNIATVRKDGVIRWTAPSGFEVIQACPKQTEFRVKTILDGASFYPRGP